MGSAEWSASGGGGAEKCEALRRYLVLGSRISVDWNRTNLLTSLFYVFSHDSIIYIMLNPLESTMNISKRGLSGTRGGSALFVRSTRERASPRSRLASDSHHNLLAGRVKLVFAFAFTNYILDSSIYPYAFALFTS